MQFSLLAGIALLLAAGADTSAWQVVSPDGRYTVSLVADGPGDADGLGAQDIVIVEKGSRTPRRLLTSRYHEDPHQNLTNIDRLLYSSDGASVYFSTSDAAPTSGAVHQIDLKSGRVRFVVSGQALSIVRTGPYRGNLMVQQHQYYDRPEGGSYNPVFVVHPDGQIALQIPGSDVDDGETAAQPWLTQHGWIAE